MKSFFEESLLPVYRRINDLVDIYFPAESLKYALLLTLVSTWLLVGLFTYLNRYTRRRYFGIWTLAWLCYALWITVIIMSLDRTIPAPLQWLREVCIGCCALALFFGTQEFSGQVRGRREMAWTVFALIVWSFLGGAIKPGTMPTTSDGVEEVLLVRRSLWVSGPLFLLLGLTNCWTACFFLQKSQKQRYIGAWILGVGFIFWAAQILMYPFLEGFDVSRPRIFLATTVTQLAVAVGMIVLVLEEARGETIWMREQVKADLRLARKLQKEIHNAEDKYEHVFEHVTDSIFIVDPSSLQILEVNRAATILTGYSREELHRLRFVNICSFLREKEKEIARDPSQVARIFGNYGNMPLQRKDNNLVLIEASASVMNNPKGPTVQIFMREVTERRRLEQQLRQAEKLSALGQLISGVAHELNNPLAVISGYAQLLAMRPTVDEKTHNDLLKIQRESERASRIVQNFLAFARKQPVEKGNVELNRLIEASLELTDYDLRASGVRVVRELTADAPPVFGDANQLEQVFLNVINNAIHAMEGSPREKILKVRTETAEGLVRTIISDTGKGIDPAILEKIFDPFFTTKDAGAGTGLGLSISFSIIKEHAGNIHAENITGSGASFIVELPASHVKPPPRASSTVVLPREAPSLVAHRSFHVLVVDDEPAIQDVFTELLTDYSCSVQSTNNGLRAIRLIQQEKFDLILCDLKMPGMDGRRLFEQVRETRPETARNFVFVTGDTNSPGTIEFLKKSGCLWATKPFNFREIEGLLSEHFGRIQDEERTLAKSQAPASR